MNNSIHDINDQMKTITQALLDCSKSIEAEDLFPVMIPEVAEILTVIDHLAFVIFLGIRSATARVVE
jgi:hypothetical protein